MPGADLQDYKGGRDLSALKKFAEGLGAMGKQSLRAA